MKKALKILLVEDHDLSRQNLKEVIQDDFEVLEASNLEQAIAILNQYGSKIAGSIIDIHLEGNKINGYQLAALCRQNFERMAIIGITGANIKYEKMGKEFDDFIIKSGELQTVRSAIKNAVFQKHGNRRIKLERFRQLQNIPGIDSWNSVIREFDSRVESLLSQNTLDGEYSKWVVYDYYQVYDDPKEYPEFVKDNIMTICLASTIGCPGKCVFCLSGRSMTRKFKRVLTIEEICGQVLLALRSYRAFKLFDEELRLKKNVVINFTCEGDSISYNIDNCCQAIKIIKDNLPKQNLSFILTSIGNEKNLLRFYQEYIDLPIMHYWSVNFMNEELRGKLMPGTKGQSLKKIRDVYEKIAQKSGKPVTASFCLIKGMNDSDGDVEMVYKFFKDRPFRIKIMPLAKDEMEMKELPDTLPIDAQIFMEKLRALGVDCRLRLVLGTKSRSGCGTTIPDPLIEKK